MGDAGTALINNRHRIQRLYDAVIGDFGAVVRIQVFSAVHYDGLTKILKKSMYAVFCFSAAFAARHKK